MSIRHIRKQQSGIARMGHFPNQGGKISAIAALAPLVWYDPATLTVGNFWANSGSYGAEWDADAAWGTGGTVVTDPSIGTSLHTSVGASPGGVYTTSYVTNVPIASSYTIGCVYRINGTVNPTNWMFNAAGTAGIQSITTNTPAYIINGQTANLSAALSQPASVANYFVGEWNPATIRNQSKYSPLSARSAVPIDMQGVILGASSAFSNFNLNARFATFFILAGARLPEAIAAIQADFPTI